MYVPAAFAETDPAKLHEFIRRHGFAVLTSHGEGGLFASHLPLILDVETGPHGTLVGHIARANPQWRRVEGEVLAVFSGPHAYVSPSWYEEGGTVPTWNYVAVHAHGTFHVVEERDGLLDILRRSVMIYESSRPAPWTFEESAPHVETMLKAIEAVKVAGSFYLIYLGIRALSKRPAPPGDTPPPPRPAPALYRQGVMTNVLNPKVALFFLAFLPQFIVPDSGLGPVPFLALGLLFVAQGTLWCVLVVLFASGATEAIRTNGRAALMLERLTGVVFIALGLNLLRARAHPG
jgi:transcriptional regulator